MTRILYYSVHESLEYDDIVLFQSLGYSVFSLGAYCPVGGRLNPFRPPLATSNDVNLMAKIFQETSCRFSFNDLQNTDIKKEFIDHFDIIVVMHDVHFIGKHWDRLRGKRVIWRTIGQAIDFYDKLAAPFRTEGLRIVRWSPREMLIENYIGHDAFIRGYKDPSFYEEWRGYLSDRFITFCSNYRGRYLEEYLFLQEASVDQTCVIGGGSNSDLPNAIGLVDFEKQLNLLRESFCYLYLHSTEVPYTLNFVEAWIVGLPVVVIDRTAMLGQDLRYNEVNDFVIDGVNGFKVKTADQAKGLMKSLLSQRDRAAEVGRRGRLSAISIFGMRRAQEEWDRLFQALLR